MSNSKLGEIFGFIGLVLAILVGAIIIAIGVIYLIN